MQSKPSFRCVYLYHTLINNVHTFIMTAVVLTVSFVPLENESRMADRASEMYVAATVLLTAFYKADCDVCVCILLQNREYLWGCCSAVWTESVQKR